MARTLDRAWAAHAIIAGLFAGLSFLLFETLAGAVLTGPDGTFVPVRMIAGIVLGAEALHTTHPLSSVIPVAVIAHLILSTAYALLYVAAVQPTPSMRSKGTLQLSTSVYGLGLWLVNFYLIAPAMGWHWFPQESDTLVQLLAHTFFYGWVLGTWLARDAVLVVEDTDYGAAARHRRP